MSAHSDQLSGIRATSYDGVGVEGECLTRPDGTSGGPAGSGGTAAGVAGSSAAGPGVLGTGTTAGVEGLSAAAAGVIGNGKTAGVVGNCTARGAAGAGVVGNGRTGGLFDGQFEGIHAVGHDEHAAGIAGYNDSSGPGTFGKSTSGPGIFGTSTSGPAGYFEGSIVVTGDIQLTGGDLAEQFEVADATGVEPGTVMVLDGADRVRVSESAYDRRVVGVLAGAGSHRPGVVLDHHAEASNRQALALVGKAYCKVDASASPVEVGDLLTTSPTRGHAMKASESDRAFGAVLGKAMESLSHGRGVLPIVVALQ